MGITPGMLIGALGAAGSLSNLFGGNQPQSSIQPSLAGFYGGAGNAAGAIGGLGQYNLGANYMGDVGGIAQGYLNNPYASGFQGGAGYFGGAGQVNALSGLGNANVIGGTMYPQIGAANQILQTGFDPQQQLYQRTAQQVSDQALAGLAGSGLQTTPWGQGVYGKTMGDFNIDWQNAQLGREATAGRAAEGLYAGAGTAGRSAFDLGTAAAGSGAAFSGLPWQTYQSILGGREQGPNYAASFGNTISQIPQTQAGDWLSYMTGQLGPGELALGAQGQQFNQGQIGGRNLGGSLALMSGQVTPGMMYGGGGGGWGGPPGGGNYGTGYFGQPVLGSPYAGGGGQGGAIPGTNPWSTWSPY